MRGTKLFTKGRLREKLKKRKDNVKDEITSTDDDTILEVNESEFIEQVVEKFRIDIPVIHFYEAHIENQGSGKDATVLLVFPCQGEKELFKYKPKSWDTGIGRWEFRTSSNEIIHEFEYSSADPQNRLSEIKKYLEKYSRRVNSQLRSFNDDLPELVEREFKKQKQETREKYQQLESLPIPLKQRSDTPDTFSISSPESQQKIEFDDADLMDSGDIPPELDQVIFQKMLQAIYDIGKGFERSPRLFDNRGEEELRDYILFYLEMNFEGSVTGETFNNRGKTDILYRYNNNNLFVAECLIWDGRKRFTEKIDQLFSYLTWRDSKTALITFVRDREDKSALEKIDAAVTEHESFLSTQDERGDSWKEYRMQLKNDSEKEIYLSTLTFFLD